MFRENSHVGGRGTLDNPLESGTLQKRALYVSRIFSQACCSSHCHQPPRPLFKSVAPYVPTLLLATVLLRLLENYAWLTRQRLLSSTLNYSTIISSEAYSIMTAILQNHIPQSNPSFPAPGMHHRHSRSLALPIVPQSTCRQRSAPYLQKSSMKSPTVSPYPS
jgi:hypothetical protein